MRRVGWRLAAAFLAALVCAQAVGMRAQTRSDGVNRATDRRDVRTVTIPVTLRLPEREPQTELRYLDALEVLEDGERQEILSTRGAGRAPMTLAVLIQDDLASSVSNEIKGLADFIRRLPPGTRVMIAYLRVGSLQVRQKFTSDLERAAKSLRIPISSSSVAPFSPFSSTRDALKRFESQPVGRRAILLISDGIDISRGFESSTPASGFDLQRAINEAQRLSVAVYSIYEPTVGAANRTLIGNGQGSLNRLSTETGGRAFFQGTLAPVSIDGFLREIDTLLSRQFALTYLSTHTDKGFHKIRVAADLQGGDIYYPAGYTR
jgi:VWFA-related protein